MLTDMPQPSLRVSASAKPSKNTRQRLLEAAKNTFHEQGVENATLAVIAEAANIPLGNVYYHFRSKDLLLEAVLDSHQEDILADLESYKLEPTPMKRLKALLRDSENNLGLLVEHSCPYASLAQRLRDQNNALANQAGGLLGLYLDFAETQFKELGRGRDAKDLAADFVARLYGAYTLSNSFNDPHFLKRQLKRIGVWLETLA